jgi:hypothetical protein
LLHVSEKKHSYNRKEKQKEIYMDKMHFSIVINAPKEKVWNTMLNDDTYRVWTEAFTPGSHYVGDWNKGSKILFLGPDKKTGKMSGAEIRHGEPNQRKPAA